MIKVWDAKNSKRQRLELKKNCDAADDIVERKELKNYYSLSGMRICR